MKSFKQFINESDTEFTLEKSENFSKEKESYYVLVDGKKVARISSYSGNVELRTKGKTYVNSRKSVKRWCVDTFYKNDEIVRNYKNGKLILFSYYMNYKDKNEAAKEAIRDLRSI